MANTYPSRVVVDLSAYRSNLELVRRFSGANTALIPVIKSNAYGHGLEPIARAALDAGAAMLGVANVREGMSLRAAGIAAPILVLSAPARNELPLFIEHQFSLMATDVGLAEAMGVTACEANRVAPVHIKVDTGMGRQGMPVDDALENIQYIARITHIDVQGICTHFPSADIVEDDYTYGQIKAFRQLMKQVDKLGIPYEMAHAANSAAIVNYRESVFDAVRPGLITYGVWPTDAGTNQTLLKRVLRWETTIVQIRTLQAGATIGYGRTYTCPKATKTAVLPVGYADGYKYQLSNKGEVLIRGKRCPIRGAVSMDQIVVEVSALPDVGCGDVATLIGADGEDVITVEEMATRAGTISYDILTGIGPRVHRAYVGAAENTTQP